LSFLVMSSSKDCLQLSLLHIYTVLSCQLFSKQTVESCDFPEDIMCAFVSVHVSKRSERDSLRPQRDQAGRWLSDKFSLVCRWSLHAADSSMRCLLVGQNPQHNSPSPPSQPSPL